jgi:glycosyltransferase involved in cell wall biosynthesis
VLAGWGNIDPAQWGLRNVFVRRGLDQASLAPLYRASNVFVLPSTGEGFPLVLQEALACGLPSVCSAETAQADSRIAALVHPVALDAGDPDGTAAAVLACVRQSIAQATPEESRRRSDLIRAWYSWPHAAQAYGEVFRNVLEPAAGRERDRQPLPAAGAGP